MRKFELTKESKKGFFGETFFRIKALIDFSIVKKGELGGWIQKEANLSQEGNAWVSQKLKKLKSFLYSFVRVKK